MDRLYVSPYSTYHSPLTAPMAARSPLTALLLSPHSTYQSPHSTCVLNFDRVLTPRRPAAGTRNRRDGTMTGFVRDGGCSSSRGRLAVPVRERLQVDRGRLREGIGVIGARGGGAIGLETLS